MIVYRTVLAVGALIGGGVLDLGEPVHDYAQVSFSDDQKHTAYVQLQCGVKALTCNVHIQLMQSCWLFTYMGHVLFSRLHPCK